MNHNMLGWFAVLVGMGLLILICLTIYDNVWTFKDLV